MNAIDLKRAEFRHYLDSCGVFDALSYALIKLYDEVEKPADAVAFVRQHFKQPCDENDYTAIPKRIEDMDASELFKKQEHELKLAQQEIAKLQQMLNSMSTDSKPFVEAVENRDDSNAYREIFNDLAYEGTLIKKHLTEEVFKKLLEQQETPSIVDCIAKVDALPRNPSGVLVLNANCYDKFGDLFEAIIKDIHCVDEVNKHPDCDWGNDTSFPKLENEVIVSSEISCCRSLANISFIPDISEHDLQIILTKVQDAIQSTQTDDKEIDGEFYKITDVKDNEPISQELLKCGLGFWSMNPQEHILWPTGRGIYINCTRTQSILINEQEHIRFISKELSGDLGLAYKNLIELIQKFSSGLEFERNDKFGWLTSRLETIGTGICCKIRLKLKEPPQRSFDELCKKLHLNVSSIDAENVVELTNRRAFGFTEFECVKAFYESIKEILNEIETKITVDDENVNETDSQEIDEKQIVVNNEENVSDENAENEQSGDVKAENKENIDEKVDGEMAQNEQVTSGEKDNEEQPNGENVDTNPPEPNESNAESGESNAQPSELNDNNADNLVEGVKDNDVTQNNETNSNETNETNPNETTETESNQNETESNQNVTESANKPSETENQEVTDAEQQPAEES